MKKINSKDTAHLIGGNFLDGYCGGAGIATLGRIALKGTLKAAFGGPVGWFLGASDIVCAGYTIYNMAQKW